jgi:cytochrome o ubiquinol oxidase subunit 2
MLISRSLKLFRNAVQRLPLIGAGLLLAGCDTVVLHPSGDVAAQQGHLLVVSTFLMLIIIVPVIALTCFFAWRYRHKNTEATYEPEWDHSTKLELIIWGAPLLIIIVLGLLTWIGTHTLDPYRPLERLDAKRAMPLNVKPMVVEVVALDWKWLFIYPDLGIASVNELAAPVDVPVEFKITASTVMNSFSIPALAGQIYAMPGMQTTLNAVINRPGDFDGFSANYSGAGFSDMKFKFHGMSKADFDQWVQSVKAGSELSRGIYAELEKPSQREPVRHYGSIDADLYHAILNRCVSGNEQCLDQMMQMGPHGSMSAAAKAEINATSGATKLASIGNGISKEISKEICTTPQLSSGKNNVRTN